MVVKALLIYISQKNYKTEKEDGEDYDAISDKCNKSLSV